MRKIIILTGIIAILALSAQAFALWQNDARVPPRFCQGIRFDGQRYENFIDDLDRQEKGGITTVYACKWKLAIANAQKSICGSSSFEPPRCNR